MKKLSEMKISERIRAVRRDVELCMKDTNVWFEMEDLVVYEWDCTYSVGIAVSYMYKSMGIKGFDNTKHYDKEELALALSFEELRKGEVCTFLTKNGLKEWYEEVVELDAIYKKWEKVFDRQTKGYGYFSDEISSQFISMMEDCVKYLESEGL